MSAQLVQEELGDKRVGQHIRHAGSGVPVQGSPLKELSAPQEGETAALCDPRIGCLLA